MRRVLWTAIIISFLCAELFAEEVRNEVVRQEGNRVVFTFDVEGSQAEADVVITFTIEGKTYRTENLHLEGDYGKVKIGKGKKVYWNVLQDFPRGYAGTLDWEIKALSNRRKTRESPVQYSPSRYLEPHGEIGVFQKVLDTDDDFAEATAALEQSIGNSNLELLGKMDISVPGNAQKARTYVLTSPALNQAATDNALSSDAYSALIMRIGVYEVSGKVNINIANPDALSNVFFEGEKSRDTLMSAANAAKNELIQVIQAVPGKVVNKQQEPIRDAKKYRGYNGDGPAKMWAKWRDFRESLLTAKEMEGTESLDSIIDELKNNASKSLQSDPERGWKVVAVKKFNDNVGWMGITNTYTELKCVNINSDFRFGDKKDNNVYPGVDHAPALPLELVIYKGKDGKWQIAQYGEMWRMQLYFWDSGYAAFAKNSLIPAIIFGDIENMVK